MKGTTRTHAARAPRSAGLAALAAGIALAAIAPGASAQAQPPAGEPIPKADPDADGGLVVPLGHSRVIEPGWRVKEVVIANDEIADIRVTSPTRILVVGKQTGSTDLTMWGENDDQHTRTTVTVEPDITALKRGLAKAVPNADLELTQSGGMIVISGVLRRAEQADALKRFMDATGTPFVDMTEVASPQQVMIKVRVAEANRVALRTLGINTVRAGDNQFFGTTFGGNPNSINIGVPSTSSATGDLPFDFLQNTNVTDTTSLFAGIPNVNFQFFVEALEDNQYIRTLAEPNLVALSGEKASFLAGGEFPIPVPQASAGGGVTITVEYREFGVKLNFFPRVRGDGTIRLQVAPEVSELSEIGSIQTEGFNIPSLLIRRAATTLVMKSGQTFAMAGLLNRDVAARSQSVPGLGSLPILGPLFRSVRYEQGDTELLILATVELVEPLDTRLSPVAPGETHEAPSDWELYAGGRLHGDDDAPSLPLGWPAEMNLDRLKGPGAWATYDQRRTPARPEPNETKNNLGEDALPTQRGRERLDDSDPPEGR